MMSSKINPNPIRGNCMSQLPILLDLSMTGGRQYRGRAFGANHNLLIHAGQSEHPSTKDYHWTLLHLRHSYVDLISLGSFYSALGLSHISRGEYTSMPADAGLGRIHISGEITHQN